MAKANWVIDYETLIDCTILVAEHFTGEEQRIFCISSLGNQLPELIQFLETNKKNNEWHISFNGLSFDSQITEYILRNKNVLLPLTGVQVAGLVYKKAQDIIYRQENKEFAEFSERDLSIRQIDVFKLNHWDNPAKRSSLKWIQFSMDWHNLLDMPIHHTTKIETKEQLDTVVTYCINDVKSTKQIMHLSKEQIMLRKSLTEEYKIPLFSASEPRISKELFLMFISEEMGVKKYDLKNLRTKRDYITVKNIILPFVKFKTKTFQMLLDNFNDLVINARDTKGGFRYQMTHKGVKTDFGLGGAHGCTKSGVYEAKDNMIIMSSDVTSFYPNLAIRNKWSPAHLDKEIFANKYEWFFEERKKLPKKDPKNYVYKIILNSTYGLSNDENSFLYDPEFTMRITINGQLTLMMLYEMLSEGIPGSVPLMQNTDGIEMMIPADKKDTYLEICKEWEQITNLQLEHDQYSKMIIGDVNNYIAVNTAGKSKCKGRFEFDNLALHKNKSHLIIPKALYAFFVNDILPEQFLQDNRNIFDYCAGVKIKGDWEFQQTCIINREITRQTLQKTLRYYISKGGCKIYKVNKSDKREIQLESGKWMQQLFNLYEEKPWSEYDIDESYYLDKIYKEINNILPKKTQLELWD
jgi:hypothetical protein